MLRYFDLHIYQRKIIPKYISVNMHIISYKSIKEDTTNMDTQNLEKYINKCIADACTSTSKKNDVRYQYRIIGNHLLFAIKSRYQDVKIRVEFRLLNNLQKNFGLDFNLVYPDPLHESSDCFEVAKFDLYPDGIDPNHSIDVWTVFGKKYTIRAFAGIRPYEEEALVHLNKLGEHGYDYMADDTISAWEKFKAAYEAAYGMTPMQGYKAVEKELMFA